MLLQAFYSMRSERLLMERLEYDLLFRWFVGIGVDDPAWDHSVFSKNRDRLLEGDIAAKFLSAVLAQPKVKKLLSSDHFSVDGTLIEAWASMKSVKPKDGSGEPPAGGVGRNAEADFHGEKRTNDTHASTTDPDAIFQGVDAAGEKTVIPAIEGRARNAEFFQRPPRRQVRLLNQADDLKFLGRGVSHSSSPPSAIMLFLRIRSASACSATTSLRSRASLRSTFTSSLVAARAVSPASRFLPASRNSFDQL